MSFRWIAMDREFRIAIKEETPYISSILYFLELEMIDSWTRSIGFSFKKEG